MAEGRRKATGVQPGPGTRLGCPPDAWAVNLPSLHSTGSQEEALTLRKPPTSAPSSCPSVGV